MCHMVRRPEYLHIRLSPDELQEIEELAEADDRSKGAMARKLITEALAARRAQEVK